METAKEIVKNILNDKRIDYNYEDDSFTFKYKGFYFSVFIVNDKTIMILDETKRDDNSIICSPSTKLTYNPSYLGNALNCIDEIKNYSIIVP